jgi:hypothetical protein
MSHALQAGQVFKACFRINSHNRSEVTVVSVFASFTVMIRALDSILLSCASPF